MIMFVEILMIYIANFLLANYKTAYKSLSYQNEYQDEINTENIEPQISTRINNFGRINRSILFEDH